MVTDVDMDDLREKATKATPGPWKSAYEENGGWFSITGTGYHVGGGWMTCPEVATMDRGESDDADAKFIAAANPAVVLALIKRVEKAERERDEWKRSDGEMCKYAGSLKSRALTAERERDALVEKIERVRSWARDQGKPFVDGIPDREGEYVMTTCLAILDGTEEANGDADR